MLVGKIVLANFEFRKRSEIIFEENFERRKEDGKKREILLNCHHSSSFVPGARTKLFWNLWSRCHARDAFQVYSCANFNTLLISSMKEACPECPLEKYVEYDGKLESDVESFCQFYSGEPILCMWTNLVGVRREKEEDSDDGLFLIAFHRFADEQLCFHSSICVSTRLL